MITFYSFCEAFKSFISNSSNQQTVGKKAKTHTAKPTNINVAVCLAFSILFLSKQGLAQSQSAATHADSDFSGLSCATRNGIYSVVYKSTIAATDPTYINYFTKQGKIKATAAVTRDDFTEVSSMIATSDQCALIAGYATGCDYVSPSSHFYLAKIDSNGTIIFSLNLLTSSAYLGATGIAEDVADSSYYVYLPNKLVHVSKTGTVLNAASYAGSYRLGKRFSNGDVIAVNSNTMLTFGDSLGFTNFYQQQLQGNARKICVTNSNLIYVLTQFGVEKFGAQLQPMGTYTVPGAIDAIDLRNDTLYMAGVISGLAFMQITDTMFSTITQYTTTTNYLRPSSISAIQGNRAAINMTGNNVLLFTEVFSNLSVTDNTGAFTFSNDVSIESVNIVNAYITVAATASATQHLLYLHLDADVIVKNKGADTVKNFYLNNVFFKQSICGLSFMHLPEVISIAPQASTQVSTGMYTNFMGYYQGATVPTTFTAPLLCFYTSIPNKTADYNPDNDYFCATLDAPVPVILNVAEMTKGNLSVNLFPNPAQELVQINCAAEEFTYSISDALGRTCLEGIGSNSIDIDCKGLTSGIYFVTVKARGYSQQKKLVIQ